MKVNKMNEKQDRILEIATRMLEVRMAEAGGWKAATAENYVVVAAAVYEKAMELGSED